MTIEQILKLIDAGYTKNEIETLSSPTSLTSPAPETTTPAPAEQVPRWSRGLHWFQPPVW